MRQPLHRQPLEARAVPQSGRRNERLRLDPHLLPLPVESWVPTPAPHPTEPPPSKAGVMERRGSHPSSSRQAASEAQSAPAIGPMEGPGPPRSTSPSGGKPPHSKRCRDSARRLRIRAVFGLRLLTGAVRQTSVQGLCTWLQTAGHTESLKSGKATNPTEHAETLGRSAGAQSPKSFA